MTHPIRIGWPTRAETLPRNKAGLNGLDDLGEPCGAECAPSGIGRLADHFFAKAGGNLLDVLGHIASSRSGRAVSAMELPAELVEVGASAEHDDAVARGERLVSGGGEFEAAVGPLD